MEFWMGVPVRHHRRVACAGTRTRGAWTASMPCVDCLERGPQPAQLLTQAAALASTAQTPALHDERNSSLSAACRVAAPHASSLVAPLR